MVIAIAVIDFLKRDLDKLAGRKLSDDDYKNKVIMLGCPLEKMDDEKVHYEISPNRPDLYSTEGFARAVRNFLGFSKKVSAYKVKKSGIRLDAGRVEARPFIAAAVVRNVKFTEEVIVSLIQLQEKLHDTIGRKRKKVAIGIHDMDKVRPPFCYKAADPDELSFVPLDKNKKMTMRAIGSDHPKGREYIHTLVGFNKWPVIVDKGGNVLSFPPIINGELTRLTNKTKNIFIDVTGTDKTAINQALNILAAALYDRGFSVETVDINGVPSPDLRQRKMAVNMDYINRLLDLDLTKSGLKELLARMGLGFDGGVIIPPYRADIMHLIDIAEDVAIGKGYSSFKPRIPRVATIAERNELTEFIGFLRASVTGMGFQEIVSAVLTNRDNEFGKMGLQSEEVCETKNPLSAECAICRKRLLPSMLKTFAQNKHRDYPQLIFEIGDTVTPDTAKETRVAVIKMLSCAVSNSVVSYEDISSYLDAFLRNLGIEYRLRKVSHASFIDGRCAEILVNSKNIGIIGEIHPQVLENWNLEKPVVAFELNAEEIFRFVNSQK